MSQLHKPSMGDFGVDRSRSRLARTPMFRLVEFCKSVLGRILANGQTIRWVTQKGILKRLVNLSAPHALAVDVGCGGGTYSIDLLGPSSMAVVALDPSWRHAWLTRKRSRLKGLGNVLVVVASAEALPFKSGIADFVLCSEVLEHVPNDSLAVQEIAYVVRPNGKLLISVPYPPEPAPNPEHLRPGYREPELRRLLEFEKFVTREVTFCMFQGTRAVIRWCYRLGVPLPLLFICQVEQYLADQGRLMRDPSDMILLAEKQG